MDLKQWKNTRQSCKKIDMYIPELSAPIDDGFESRLTAVHETATFFGLNAQNAIIIGGGALTLHGIDAYVRDRHMFDEAFDLDVLLAPDCPSTDSLHILARASIGTYSHPNAPLELTLLSRHTAKRFPTSTLGYSSTKAMMDDRVEIDGLTTISVDGLIRSKEKRGEIKDHAGIIKAHLRATATGHEICNNPAWQQAIHRIMVKLAVQHQPDTTTGRFSEEVEQFPWLAELLTKNFEHPAFADL